MESIYYVVSWLCHRTCEHCYEDRFRPYYGADLEAVVSQGEANFRRIVANLPEKMTYLDWNEGLREKAGRVILAGGEVLLEPVRTRILYPALDLLHARYGGCVHLIVQTTGDLVTNQIVDELLAHHSWMISVSGMDDYHEGLQPALLQEKLSNLFQAKGLRSFHPGDSGAGPYYHFFGATPDSWIGRLWPRGRARANELSTATLADNFCNRWSGGLNFLQSQYSGSEVSVDPEGFVFPCCLKTRLPLGNLLEESLERIVERASGNPVYEAISMGHPERMGITHGWTIEKFLSRSTVRLASGREYQNLCIGCDRFHEEVLMAQPLVQIAAHSARRGTGCSQDSPTQPRRGRVVR